MEIEIVRKILQKNDRAAEENRARFKAAGITCINLLGGAGCGKTTLLENLIPLFPESAKVAVLEGDVATTRDSERIARLGTPVVQLLTEGGCHLTATLVEQGCKRLRLDDVRILFVENVGNPICPANFDLGEQFRISVLSVTEGDDKPLKYPLLFHGAAVTVITKCDLLPYNDFDVESAERELSCLNPNMLIVRTDVRTGSGFEWLQSWVMKQIGRIGVPTPMVRRD